MKISLPLLAALCALVPSATFATGFSFGAAVSSGFALADGTDLATGSLIRFGTFSLTPAQISANATDLVALEAAFTELHTATIGEGNPAASLDGPTGTENAGLFVSSLTAIDTTSEGLNIAGLLLYYWVFDSATVGTATQHGIFSSNNWVIPNDGTLDNFSLNTDIIDLTTGATGSTLDSAAILAIGTFGPGTNATGLANGIGGIIDGAVEFNLASIPEPATTASLAGLAILAFAAASRRRRV